MPLTTTHIFYIYMHNLNRHTSSSLLMKRKRKEKKTTNQIYNIRHLRGTFFGVCRVLVHKTNELSCD
jgi:hypothetical protein